MLGPEDVPVADGDVDRLDDRRRRMPEERRALAEQVVDVVVPVDIPQPGALTAGEEDRRGVETDVRIDPAGQDPARLARQALRGHADAPLRDRGHDATPVGSGSGWRANRRAKSSVRDATTSTIAWPSSSDARRASPSAPSSLHSWSSTAWSTRGAGGSVSGSLECRPPGSGIRSA